MFFISFISGIARVKQVRGITNDKMKIKNDTHIFRIDDFLLCTVIYNKLYLYFIKA